MSSFNSLTQVIRLEIDPDYEVIRDDLRSELENGVLPHVNQSFNLYRN